MTYYSDQKAGTALWAQSGARQSQVTVFLAQENARSTLETGVITVRDLINRGAMPGPRMIVSGYGLSVTRRPARPVLPSRPQVRLMASPRCSASCGSRRRAAPT